MADRHAIAAELRNHLLLWQSAGLDVMAAPQPAGNEVAEPAPVAPSADNEASSPRGEPAVTTETALSPPPSPTGSLPMADLTTLDGQCQALQGCVLCGLAAGRTNIVFGVGSPNAEVVFVGEAPGRDEDREGEPFIGRAGQLLTDIIEKGMGLPRAEIYICNTVKCRPPENRNPLPEESATCEPFLVRQLLTIRPKVIVALGKFAAQALCRSEVPISRLRGNWHEYEGMAVMPTFHPAYLLRNRSAKRQVWDDIQQVMERLKISPGKRDGEGV